MSLTITPTRRLIFRIIILSKPTSGKLLLATLRAEPSLGDYVRTLKALPLAYRSPSTTGTPSAFDDLIADDIIRLCPLLTSLELPIGPFGKVADGRAPTATFPESLKHYKSVSLISWHM